MIKISVVIPTYEPKDYLWECLASLRNQTLHVDSFEIIIVLNGNLIPYSKLIQDFIELNFVGFHVNFIQTSLAGVSNARNLGLKAALGEYICFIDDDDVVSSNYLEELLKLSSDKIVGVSNIHSFKKSIKDYNNNFFACKIVQRRKYCNSLFLNRSILSFPVGKLIHRNIIRDHLFDLRFKNGEDALFMTQISDKIMGFNFTPSSACYFVRERIGSATRHKFKDKKRFIKDAFLLLKAYVLIYLSNPISYNLLLFLSRIPGVIKGTIILLWRNR